MRYRPTILNILSGGLLIWMVVQLIVFSLNSTGAGGEAWGGVAIIALIVLSLFGLGVDFVIQLATKNRKAKSQHLLRNGAGLILLVGLYYFNQNHCRELNIIIPERYDDAVGIIYDFPETAKLPRNILTLNSSVELPESGLIFTSSSIRDNDIPYTNFITKTGEYRQLGVNGVWERRYSDEIQMEYLGENITVRIINVGEESNGREKIAACEKRIRNLIKENDTTTTSDRK